ncbi:MAG: hypothetical protein LUE93_02020 [Bacteroides sp.]|nr:hypothetical protein [Bacteroides sp.]
MEEAELVVQRKEDCGCEEGSVKHHIIALNKMDIASVEVPVPEPQVTETRPATAIEPPAQKQEGISTGITSLEGVAYLDFPFEQSYIVEHYANNEKELDEIKRNLNTILLNEKAEIKVIYLTGYSSIDGTYADNYQLSKRRTEALRDYIRERYDLAAGLFILDWKGEDWAGLAKLVEPSGTPYKEAVLNIIEEVDIFNGREKKLMDLYGGSPYKYMQKHFFPLLRRVEYKIEYVVRE